MNTPSTIEVVITPRDVLTGIFSNCTDCPLAKAIKRKAKTDTVRAAVTFATIDGVRYSVVENFEHEEFRYLHERAENGERFKIKKTLTRQV
jgi:hypothetical protein